MKIRKILENNLPSYRGEVRGLNQWIDIRNSGKWDPTEVQGNMDFRFYDLKTLNDMPRIVHGDFDCSFNLLTNLTGAPDKIFGSFHCNTNKLETIEGIPPLIADTLFCQNNKLTSLKNIHKNITHLVTASFKTNPITSHILGLLLIKGFKHVVGDGAEFEIIDNHLKGNKDVLECQEELISAGYKEFAKL